MHCTSGPTAEADVHASHQHRKPGPPSRGGGGGPTNPTNPTTNNLPEVLGQGPKRRHGRARALPLRPLPPRLLQPLPLEPLRPHQQLLLLLLQVGYELQQVSPHVHQELHPWSSGPLNGTGGGGEGGKRSQGSCSAWQFACAYGSLHVHMAVCICAYGCTGWGATRTRPLPAPT